MSCSCVCVYTVYITHSSNTQACYTCTLEQYTYLLQHNRQENDIGDVRILQEVHLVKHNVGIGNNEVWLPTEGGVNLRVRIQWRILLLAQATPLHPTPDIVSEIVLTYHLHHRSSLGLLHKRLIGQHLLKLLF